MNENIFHTYMCEGVICQEDVDKIKEAVNNGIHIFVLGKNGCGSSRVLSSIMDFIDEGKRVLACCKNTQLKSANLSEPNSHNVDLRIVRDLDTHTQKEARLKSDVVFIEKLNDYVKDLKEKSNVTMLLNTNRLSVVTYIQLPMGASTQEGNMLFNLNTSLNSIGVADSTISNQDILIIQMDTMDDVNKIYIKEIKSSYVRRKTSFVHDDVKTPKTIFSHHACDTSDIIANLRKGLGIHLEVDYDCVIPVGVYVKYNGTLDGDYTSLKKDIEYSMVTLVKDGKVSTGVKDLEEDRLVWVGTSEDLNVLFDVARYDKPKRDYSEDTLTIDELDFVLTCSACPEQYDIFDKYGNEIAYFRLRWGELRVECPFAGVVVYSAETIGQGSLDNTESSYHLAKAKLAIVDYYNTERD